MPRAVRHDQPGHAVVQAGRPVVAEAGGRIAGGDIFDGSGCLAKGWEREHGMGHAAARRSAGYGIAARGAKANFQGNCRA